ncbi:MAG: sigma-70 family RNA polymerase sigma factor [Tepidisphaeraceae bacterium]
MSEGAMEREEALQLSPSTDNAPAVLVDVAPLRSGAELLAAYRRDGRAEDFEQIVDRYAGLVLSECRRVCRHSHDAEDAAQLVFLHLAMQARIGPVIEKLGPWLQRVARRQAMKLLRTRGRQAKRDRASTKPELQFIDPAEPIDSRHVAGILRDEVDRLPASYRMPLVLHYFGGMSLELIAKELKINRQAVGTRLHRGRRLLAERLQPHGLDVRVGRGATALLLASLVPAAVLETLRRSVRGFTFTATTTASAATHGSMSTARICGSVNAIVRGLTLRAARCASVEPC